LDGSQNSPQATTFSFQGNTTTVVTEEKDVSWEATPCGSYFFQACISCYILLTLFLAQILFALMMKAIFSSETPALTKSTRHHIPEDGILHKMIILLNHKDMYFMKKRETNIQVFNKNEKKEQEHVPRLKPLKLFPSSPYHHTQTAGAARLCANQ
jgi:hypothetical protein